LLAYIKGEITFKTPTYVHLESNGLGYHVNISLNTFSKLDGLDRVKMYIYLQVKEDSHTLYGFFSEKEKAVFVSLISVSGIGANTARVILSSMTADEVNQSIANSNVERFKAVKGIGAKTAQRLILDLKDKVIKSGFSGEENIVDHKSGNSIRQEAISALQSLGFQKNTVLKKVDLVLSQEPNLDQVEDLIKRVLKLLS